MHTLTTAIDGPRPQSTGSQAGAHARANILGVGVSPINMDIALDTMDDWIARRDPHYVCVTGVHGVMESQ
jgi:N-acetylglucosaminyldiphosphoundecaprenol N-acetyl-beta-D-mannosaminyltransferase